MFKFDKTQHMEKHDVIIFENTNPEDLEEMVNGFIQDHPPFISINISYGVAWHPERKEMLYSVAILYIDGEE